MRKIFIIPLLLLLCSCSAYRGGPAYVSRDPAAALNSALEEVRLGHSKIGEKTLLRIKKEYTGTIWAGRASFILGNEALNNGKAGAVSFLREALSLEALRPYVLVRLARAYQGDGNLNLAERTYSALIKNYPNFAFRGDTLYERALLLEKMGRVAEAKSTLKIFIKKFPGHAKRGDALLRVVKLNLSSNEYRPALKNMKRLLINYPAETSTLKAEDILKRQKELPSISLLPAERCKRTEALFKSGEYNRAAAELKDLIKEDNFCAEKAEPLLVEALFRVKKYDEAESILKRRIRRGRRGHERGYAYRRALSLLSTVYLRENKTTGLMKTIHSLEQNFPHSSETRRALLMRASLYDEDGRWNEALKTYGLILKKDGEIKKSTAGGSKKLDAAAIRAAWRRGWLLYRMGRYLEAYRGLATYTEELKGRDRHKFAYWQGRALEKAGLIDDAQEEYSKACESAKPDYYCDMAKKRLNGQAMRAEFSNIIVSKENKGQSNKNEEEKRANALRQRKSFKTVFALISTGLTREAAVEAKMALKDGAPEREVLSGLMRAFYEAGDYYRAIWIYDSYSYLLNKGEKGFPSGLTSVAFPIKIVDYMSAKGLTGKADPLLVAAVMREESSFNPKVISRTGAIGLMQVMPSTAKFIADASKMGPLSASDILDPDTNIRLGAWYIAYLWRKTGGDPLETIAGYNAGLNAVKKWRARYPFEDDEFIESIPYTETRNYTKKVLKSYEAFRAIAAQRNSLLAYSPKTKGAARQ